MAQVVTRPVEEALRVIPGVQEVRSGSSRGSAQISVDFGWGTRHDGGDLAGRYRALSHHVDAAARHQVG